MAAQLEPSRRPLIRAVSYMPMLVRHCFEQQAGPYCRTAEKGGLKAPFSPSNVSQVIDNKMYYCRLRILVLKPGAGPSQGAGRNRHATIGDPSPARVILLERRLAKQPVSSSCLAVPASAPAPF